MKALLKFDLPEEGKEFAIHSKALDLAYCLVSLERKITRMKKNAVLIEPDDVLCKFYESLDEYGVNLDNLI